MESKTILVSLLVVVLGIVIAIAGFIAEAKRVRASPFTVVYADVEPECEYPISPVICAVAAIVALCLARAIITSASGGCCSCLTTAPNRSIFPRVSIVLSWITSCITVILFLTGALLSTQQDMEREVNGEYYCYTVRSGVFSGAGIVGLVSVILGLVYYLWYIMAARSGATARPPVDLELQKPPVTSGLKPHVPMQKH